MTTDGRLTADQSSPTSFSPQLKDRALMVLEDYSSKTGKKWTAICSEILTATGAPSSKRSPILTRQNLESWAVRGSELSDPKFKWVYKFLTLPETLKRPEFIGVHSILSDQFITVSTGLALEKLHGLDNRRRTVEHAIGTYQLETDDDDLISVLKIVPVSGCRYLEVHIISGKPRASTSSDWNVDRISGYGIFPPGVLYLKDAFGGEREVSFCQVVGDRIELSGESLFRSLVMTDFRDMGELAVKILVEHHVMRGERVNKSDFDDVFDSLVGGVQL